jgi:hypothetical protein
LRHGHETAEIKNNSYGTEQNILRPTAGHSVLDVCEVLKVGNESEKITACRKRWKGCRVSEERWRQHQITQLIGE